MKKDGSGRRASFSLRPQVEGDEAVVARAHVEHRRALFAALHWPTDALERLCLQQHELQERHIAAHHPLAEMTMIEAGGRTAGRLCLDRGFDPWRIVDIALVPEAQGRGTGSAAIRRILSEAEAAGASVELHVALDNPRAEGLYRRLGFRDAISGASTHRRLLWSNHVSPQLKTA